MVIFYWVLSAFIVFIGEPESRILAHGQKSTPFLRFGKLELLTIS